MTSFQNKIRFILLGIRSRLVSLQFGIVYLRSVNLTLPKNYFVNGKFIKLNLNQKANDLFLTEFFSICISDSYKLGALSNESIKKVLDIGANQGLFVLVARKKFPKATIHAYEPNNNLNENISFNCEQLNSNYFEEAIMPFDCKVELAFSSSDLATQALPNPIGHSTGISLTKAIERLGGKVDLVKMDCEGGEWCLLDLPNDWKNIRYLTMEYHLWHGNGHSIEELKEKIENINFKILLLRPITKNCGIVFAKNSDDISEKLIVC
jgi:FkbM family methyltransferase